MQTISVDQITVPPELEAQANQKEVQRYRLWLRTERPIPPVRVEDTTSGYVLLAGVERLMALRAANKQHVQAVIEPRTQEERFADVMVVLNNPDWRAESNSAIASYAYVRRHLVAEIRANLPDVPPITQVHWGPLTYTRRIARPGMSTPPVVLHNEPFLAAPLEPESIDVIMTVPPSSSSVSIADYAERMIACARSPITIYLWFTPAQLQEMASWQHALDVAGFLFKQLIGWSVRKKDRATGLPDYEQILVMGSDRDQETPYPLVEGPRPDPFRKPTWLTRQLLAPYAGKTLLDPFVLNTDIVDAARQCGLTSVIGCRVD